MKILLDKILKSKVGCPPKIFTKIKNIYSGAVPGFFWIFFYTFSMVSIYFFVFEKNFGGQPTLLFKILSNKILI